MQFDVHRNIGIASDRAPFLADIQSDRVQALRLRVVVPLVRADYFNAIRHLNPSVEIEGERVIVSTAELFAVDQRRLGPVVASLGAHREAIVRALDLLFTGV
jgi:toxin CcdB